MNVLPTGPCPHWCTKYPHSGPASDPQHGADIYRGNDYSVEIWQDTDGRQEVFVETVEGRGLTPSEALALAESILTGLRRLGR